MCQIPPNYTVYDYYFDMKKDKSFKPWSMKVPAFVYDKEVPYFELLVPTTDTYKFSFCLELLLSKEKNAFFTGMTGVGKSSVISEHSAKTVQDEKDVVGIFVNFSAQTTSTRTQIVNRGQTREEEANPLWSAARQEDRYLHRWYQHACNWIVWSSTTNWIVETVHWQERTVWQRRVDVEGCRGHYTHCSCCSSRWR